MASWATCSATGSLGNAGFMAPWTQSNIQPFKKRFLHGNFQSAVSPTSSRQPRGAGYACGLEIRDTAGWKPALRTARAQKVRCAHHARIKDLTRPSPKDDDTYQQRHDGNARA